ncbi:glycerol dehydrogenase [Desulfofustis glycolicus]|uniref:Glycerol dehydrogenase n=1 Tax=Desulfofustis glycolicus DSM 9705 TaxID=1121409 RepID=A0A1M5RZ13_9BACT|nr:glycerol dehydrogenase [Desulfofustis glycolicus]MCB2216310.1 glycerol dehydrogenase [Desulfobulbaceae bacterium]SHH31465.1 glycerol dehydrogenase [Desulfofustis glycolicus DSM 9705]
MIRGFGSPGRYFQGADITDQAGRFLKHLGKKFFLIADPVVYGIAGERLNKSLEAENLHLLFPTPFQGECCQTEIQRITSLVRREQADVIIGMGGGKAADTAKMVNIATTLPVVIIPTVASTDAPTSQLAVVYDEQHVKAGVFFMSRGPDLVLVDTAIIARAPIRTFRAGIGDALSTSFEAEACHASQAKNIFGVRPTRAALELARLSFHILKANAMEALAAVSAQTVTDELETVVEATILLSGLGFESGGLAAAHSIHGGFTALPAMQKALHGELVAFGVLAQCVLEGKNDAELQELLWFYRALDLPMTLAELGLSGNVDDSLVVAVKKICVPGSYIYNMPVAINEETVLHAIKKADRLAVNYKAKAD